MPGTQGAGTAPSVNSAAPRYSGHERDAFTALTYMKARAQLASWDGRFNRPDPQRDWIWTDPSSVNLYQYVRDNPINGYDPTGEELGTMTAGSLVGGGSSATAFLPVVGAAIWGAAVYQTSSYVNEQTGFSDWLAGKIFESMPYPAELPATERPVEATTTHIAEGNDGEGAQAEEFDVLEDANLQGKTRKGSTVYNKPGGEAKANEEFDKMNLDNVKDEGEGKRIGTDSQGRTVAVRPTSKYTKDPTIEIQIRNNKGNVTKRIKIRYKEKSSE